MRILYIWAKRLAVLTCSKQLKRYLGNLGKDFGLWTLDIFRRFWGAFTIGLFERIVGQACLSCTRSQLHELLVRFWSDTLLTFIEANFDLQID